MKTWCCTLSWTPNRDLLKNLYLFTEKILSPQRPTKPCRLQKVEGNSSTVFAIILETKLTGKETWFPAEFPLRFLDQPMSFEGGPDFGWGSWSWAHARWLCGTRPGELGTPIGTKAAEMAFGEASKNGVVYGAKINVYSIQIISDNYVYIYIWTRYICIYIYVYTWCAYKYVYIYTHLSG